MVAVAVVIVLMSLTDTKKTEPFHTNPYKEWLLDNEEYLGGQDYLNFKTFFKRAPKVNYVYSVPSPTNIRSVAKHMQDNYYNPDPAPTKYAHADHVDTQIVVETSPDKYKTRRRRTLARPQIKVPTVN